MQKPGALKPSGPSNLVLRVVAALVLAPLAILIAWLGGYWWIALCIVAGIGLLVEWIGITGKRPLWLIAGLIYAFAPALSAIALRLDATHGLWALLFVLTIVWASDILGYVCGRMIGGPKLWPRVSPKKTWAGAIGGLAGAVLIGLCFAWLGYRAWPLAWLAGALAIAAQAGDLFESAIKRHFNVKDSSQIIPGHGGIMDRLDAFVFAATLAALFGFIRSGGSSAAAGLIVW